jgi:uncharacterized protein
MEQWALITGASSGIGREFAEVCADNGWNLVLTARNQERLTIAAEELRAVHKVQTRVAPIDLSLPEAPEQLFRALSGVPISLLISNAGFGTYGPFAEANLAVQTEMVQVNVTALMQLTRLFLEPMLQRGSGRILHVASTAAFQPGPMVSVYYASKAFVLSFSYALADELKDTGVSVTALCPGMTRTDFQKRAGMKEKRSLPMMSPRTVAEAGYRGLLRGKRVVIPGLMNRIGAFLARRAPLRLTSSAVRKVHEPGSG